MSLFGTGIAVVTTKYKEQSFEKKSKKSFLKKDSEATKEISQKDADIEKEQKDKFVKEGLKAESAKGSEDEKTKESETILNDVIDCYSYSIYRPFLLTLLYLGLYKLLFFQVLLLFWFVKLYRFSLA